MSKITFVTALYNLKRETLEGGFSRSMDHYFETFAKLLKQDINLVIYCDKETEEFIWNHRQYTNTKVLCKPIDFPFVTRTNQIRTNPEWYGQAGWLEQSPQAKLEHYNPLVMSKQFMLNDASIHNYFGSKYFLWIDAGIANTLNVEHYFNSPQFEYKLEDDVKRGKYLYLAFPYDGQEEVHGFKKSGMNNFAGKNTEYVCRGGFFGGTRAAINKANDVYYKALDSTLNAGYMGTEESIFTIISYTHPHLFNVQMIDANGLVSTFFDRVVERPERSTDELALYFLTFNAPLQLEECMSTFEKNFPDVFKQSTKYVINNSTDKTTQNKYNTIFEKYNITEHKFNNIGITGGREFATEHFDKSHHSYMVFFEDDMILNGPEHSASVCKSGFKRYDPDLFEKSIEILEENELDYLKLSFSEFFGDNHENWTWYNLDPGRKEQFLKTEECPETKTRTLYTGCNRGLAYSVGEYFYCNWPVLFSKEGNRKFIKHSYTHPRMSESSLMAETQIAIRKGHLKVGCLLASPVTHIRKVHYASNSRIENSK